MFKGSGADTVNTAIEKIIKPLAEQNITAIIAGGFMRDNALGKPWRDIDLYVPAGDWSEAVYTLYGDEDTQDAWDGVTEFSKGDREYDHQSIVWQIEKASPLVDGALVNLIGIQDGSPTCESVVEKFNFGLSKIATNGFTGLVHDDFTRDMVDSQITLLRLDWGLEASMKGWLKLQHKYPWPLRTSLS